MRHLEVEHEWWAGRGGVWQERKPVVYMCFGKQSGSSSKGYPERHPWPSNSYLGIQTQERWTPTDTEPCTSEQHYSPSNSRMDKLSVHQLTNEQNVYIYQHSGTLSRHHKELRTEKKDEMIVDEPWDHQDKWRTGLKRPHTKLHAVSHLNLNHLCARWVRW